MNPEPKTLVILTPAFPANESETYWVPSQQLLVKSIKKNFPHINIIVLSYFYPYKKLEYFWNGMKVISFDGLRQNGLNRLLLFRNIWKMLKKIKKENNLPGIISFWCREGALVGSWFAKKYKIKHTIWICGQDAKKENKLVKFIRLKNDELAAMSDFLADEFHKNHKVRPKHIIENAIEPESFPLLTNERNIDILGVGSFEPLKQYDVFIEIVNDLKNKIPKIKALHCGIGREEQKIRLLIKKFGLENNFQLLGGKSHEEVLKLMQRTKIFLHTSNYEGFSTVCLEALYAGAHVISFTKPMHHDIKNWHIVKTKEEMITKASELLQTANLPHERVLVYSIEDSAKKMMQLFVQSRNGYYENS